jgi:hypothetical protein
MSAHLAVADPSSSADGPRRRARLADRLDTARRGRFVGRADELAIFLSALHDPDPPYCVLQIYAPGGTGKTALLKEYAAACACGGVPYALIDGGEIAATRDAFLAALVTTPGFAPHHDPSQIPPAGPERQVLLIDAYELLAPLDDWLRDTLLAQLPEGTLIVLAGRQIPSVGWRGDPGWQSVMRLLPLPNLNADESRAYLGACAVPVEQHEAILRFTHGHPLALSLVADLCAQRREIQFQPGVAPDIARILAEQLVRTVPGQAYRAALEVCALAPLTTEALLAETLDLPDVHDLFAWLRGLSIIEARRFGVRPVGIAREVLATDLRWRNPDWHEEIIRRLRACYAAALDGATGQEQRRLLADLASLQRDNPAIEPFLTWEDGDDEASPAALHDADLPAVQALIARHEGPQVAELVAGWCARQPEGAILLRDAAGAPLGFALTLDITALSADERATDPALAATWAYLARHAPLRPGERATFVRCWLTRDGYQDVSPLQSRLFAALVQQVLIGTPPAFTFIACANAEFWSPCLACADFQRLPEADFAIGERQWGVFGHDWRAVPLIAWRTLLADRTTAPGELAVGAPQPTNLPPTLTQDEFYAAVREALRDYTRPDALRSNPLLRAKLVRERAGATATREDQVAALRALLAETVALLQGPPRDAKLYRVLLRTYIQPAPTQEIAAELLDLPFSTYRRHLQAGIARVAALLWSRDTA